MSHRPGMGVPGKTLPEVDGRSGGRQGGRGPAPGSAWVKFKATQVVGAQGAGIFSSVPPEETRKEFQSEEDQIKADERRARKCGDLSWVLHDVPPPSFFVYTDPVGPSMRADLTVYVKRRGQDVVDVRFHGPRRHSVQEARKDGTELRLEAFRTAHEDPELRQLQSRLFQLQSHEWSAEELVGSAVSESAERSLPSLTTATQAEKLKQDGQSFSSFREWNYSRQEVAEEKYQPKGPGWTVVSKTMAAPRLSGVWYVHERQGADGKFAPWLFFNATTGKYYKAEESYGDAGKFWVQTGCPHQPMELPVTISHGSVCLPAPGGRKDDLAVALAELGRTGSALKQPLPFLDKPSALYLLVDGLRGATAAAEFVAKRFHMQFLPRLSARNTALEDHEILTIISEAIEQMDLALIESPARYAGACLAVALVIGRRLVVGSLGDCRVLVCQPGAQQAASASAREQSRASRSTPWQIRTLPYGSAEREIRTAAVGCDRQRLLQEYAPLDIHGEGVMYSTSASVESLAAIDDEQERAIFRVARAAHPFAALDLKLAQIQGGSAAVREAVERFEAVAHPQQVAAASQDLSRLTRAASAHGRVTEAASTVEAMIRMDPFGTQLLAELYYAMDEEGGMPSQRRAAALLGVEPGCDEAVAQAGIDRRYRALIAALSTAAPEQCARGMRILAELKEVVTQPKTLWTPEDRSARVTHALGLRDMKTPRNLVGTQNAAEVVRLDAGLSYIVLLTDGARSLGEARLGEIVGLHYGKPRAMCLRITADAQATTPGEAVGAIAVHVDVGEDEAEASRPPDPKKRKVRDEQKDAKPQRVRICHVLLKYAGLDKSDPQARRLAPPDRTQMCAERELLQLLEEVRVGDPKTLATRFAQACREKSDCKSALNTPHADIGWMSTPSQWGKEFDTAAFELAAGQVSDIIITPRGAHLLYRLA